MKASDATKLDELEGRGERRRGNVVTTGTGFGPSGRVWVHAPGMALSIKLKALLPPELQQHRS